jgi:hypothetical protein
MEPDDLLGSRNARPQKGGRGSLVVLLLAERAQWRINQATLESGVWDWDDTHSGRSISPTPEGIPSELGGSILSVDTTSECTQLKSCL